MDIQIDVSGDIAGVTTLAKQIEFGTAKTLTDVVVRSQKNIIPAIKDEFVTRGDWYLPSRRFGVRVETAKRQKLEAAVYSGADWLLEEEGYHGGVKKSDKSGGHLAVPDVQYTRHGIQNKIQRGEKARTLLNNTKRTKAFKLRTKGGYTLILQRVGISDEGALLQNKRGNYLRGRGKNRPSTLITKYIFRDDVKVPQKKIFQRTAIATIVVQLPSYFSQNIEKAIKSAKISSK